VIGTVNGVVAGGFGNFFVGGTRLELLIEDDGEVGTGMDKGRAIGDVEMEGESGVGWKPSVRAGVGVREGTALLRRESVGASL